MVPDPVDSVPFVFPPRAGRALLLCTTESKQTGTSGREMDVDTREELAEATAMLETAKVQYGTSNEKHSETRNAG